MVTGTTVPYVGTLGGSLGLGTRSMTVTRVTFPGRRRTGSDVNPLRSAHPTKSSSP